MIKIIINLILLIIIIFLLYFTVVPIIIYDCVTQVIYSDENLNTNSFLNNKIGNGYYIIPENQYSIYRSLGIHSYDALTNRINIKLNNSEYSFDIDKDRDQIILFLLSSKQSIS